MGQTTFTGPVVSQNGFIDNSFTDAERDAIVDPQPGLLIWNTTSNEYQVCTVGGGSPTWDSAFGGGGGGGGAFPYLLSPLNLQGPAVGGPNAMAMPLLFSPNGLQVTTVTRSMGQYPIVRDLTTPYDLNSSFNTTNLPEVYSIPGNRFIGSFFNASGTEYTYLVTDAFSGIASVFYVKYTLTTPYNMTTATYSTYGQVYPGSGLPSPEATAAVLSTNGTKLIIAVSSTSTYDSTIVEISLGTAYDLATAGVTNVYSITSIMQNIAGPNARVYGLAFNPSGTVAYVATDSAGSPRIIQFQLGTPYSLNSISSSYLVSPSIPASMPQFQDWNWSLTVIGNSTQLFVGYYAMGNASWASGTLTALAAPNITGVSPSSGASGTNVTITGTGFTGTTAVTFDGISVSFMVMNDTSIFTSSPSTTPNVPVDVVVTNPAGSSTEVAAFTTTASPAPPPSIMALNPNTVSTSGGPFDIYGSYFTGATAVTIGSNPAASFNVANDGFIQVSAGPQPAGSVNVSVTTPSGTSSPNGSSVLTFQNPTVTWGNISAFPGSTYTYDYVNISGSGSPGSSATLYFGNPSDAMTLMTYPIGTVFTVVNGSGIGVGDTFTTTNGWTFGGGEYYVDATYGGMGYMSPGVTVSRFSV